MKSKIIVPQGLFKLYRGVLDRTEQAKEACGMFKNTNNIYVFNINNDPNKHLSNCNVMENWLNDLNILGDIEINFKNIDDVSWRNMDELKLKSKNIYINCDNSIVLSRIDFDNVGKLEAENIYIKGSSVNLELKNVKTLKNIKIDVTNPEYSLCVDLEKMPNLETVDISSAKEVEISDNNEWHFGKKLPKDFKLILNKDLVIRYNEMKPTLNPEIKSMFEGYDKMYERIELKLKINKLFKDYITKDNKIEVPFNIWKKRICEYANNKTKEILDEDSEKEKNAIELKDTLEIKSKFKDERGDLIK